MDSSLHPLSNVLERADEKLRAGSRASARIWPTGLDILDDALSGGFRSGELVLLGGPQGIGKTTWALQVARNVAASGRPVAYFCFEHDPQNLLIRLVAMEAGEIAGFEAPSLARIRQSFEAEDDRSGSIIDRLEDTNGGVDALVAVRGYSDHLVVHRSTGSSTSLDVVRAAVSDVATVTGASPFVVIDYLQKVKPADPTQSEDERVTHVVEGLKDLALEADLPVLAIVAADKDGIASGKRMRVADLRGSSSLAYEADTVLILNNKYDVVARHHLMYDMGATERYQHWVVVSIEKNRSGRDAVDLEFQKRFEQSRFEPKGKIVTEKLVDARVFTE